MEVYTIYHCPAQKKVGCTKDFTRRQKQYGNDKLWPLVVLEGVSVKEAADEEWWWADFYQYKRGRNYACITTERSRNGGKIGGKIAVESGQLANTRSAGGKIGGKIQGRKNVESGHLASISSAGGKIGGKKSKGKLWFNNGLISTRAFECPDGFVPGRLKFQTKKKM